MECWSLEGLPDSLGLGPFLAFRLLYTSESCNQEQSKSYFSIVMQLIVWMDSAPAVSGKNQPCFHLETHLNIS